LEDGSVKKIIVYYKLLQVYRHTYGVRRGTEGGLFVFPAHNNSKKNRRGREIW